MSPGETGRQGDEAEREGQKPQWSTPKTADGSFGNSCYCQQLQCPFSLQTILRPVSQILTFLLHKSQITGMNGSERQQ